MYKIGDVFYEYENYTEKVLFCNENGFIVEEIDADEKGRRFKIVQPVISRENLKQIRIQELKEKLRETDYVVTKLAEMQITNNPDFNFEFNRYQDIIQNRILWRSEIDKLLNE